MWINLWQFVHWSYLPQKWLVFANYFSLPNFYPNWSIFLHGYIRHIRDIFQLWARQGSNPQNCNAENAKRAGHAAARLSLILFFLQNKQNVSIVLVSGKAMDVCNRHETSQSWVMLCRRIAQWAKSFLKMFQNFKLSIRKTYTIIQTTYQYKI